jgi:hypothetical protein
MGADASGDGVCVFSLADPELRGKQRFWIDHSELGEEPSHRSAEASQAKLDLNRSSDQL